MKYLALDSQTEQRVGYQQLIKEQNIKRIFDLVRSGKCASRAELVRAMHLSATTVSALVEELADRGLILETGPSYTTLPGRRPMKLRLNPSGRQLAIFSLNRRGIRFALLDLSCRIIETFFVNHPVTEDANACGHMDFAKAFEEILLHKSKYFNRKEAIVIGVSFPGIYIEEEQAFSVRAAMNVSFTEASMRELEQRMGIPLLLANVSMCLAYAEKKRIDDALGDENECRDLLFINVCDGVGAGIISEGSVMTGAYSTAGEFGHIPVEPEGKPCRCGNRGCLEQYANQNAMLSAVAEACQRSGEEAPLQFSDLGAFYSRSETARNILDSIARKLAFGILSLSCITGIRRISVGGGIEILGAGFLQRVREDVQRCQTLTAHMKLDYARVGADGDSIGLAHYFLDKGYRILLNPYDQDIP